RRQNPHRGGEERHVDLAALARSLAPEEGGGDAAGDARAADEVAEGRPLRHVRLPRGREPIGDAAARPERDAVVAAATGVRAAPPLAMSARVDEPRVHATEVLVGEAQPLARVVEEAGEEDVGTRDEAVEKLPAGGLGEVQADAALVPPELLDDEVPAGRAGDEPAGDEAADRIAEARVLDLEHLGAPVAEHGPCRRHEAPLGHLEHADAVENARHGPTLGRAAVD